MLKQVPAIEAERAELQRLVEAAKTMKRGTAVVRSITQGPNDDTVASVRKVGRR